MRHLDIAIFGSIQVSARHGHAPAALLFEAAGAGACLIADSQSGIETFLVPGREALLAAAVEAALIERRMAQSAL